MVGLSATDVVAVAEAARRLNMSPTGLVGRLAGLSGAEQRSIPSWGWYGAAFVAGVGSGIALLRWALPRLEI